MENEEDILWVVKSFLRKLGDREATREEVAEIAPALDAIYWRLILGRQSAPALDLSRSAWDLLEVLGRGPHPPGDRGPTAVSSALPRPTGTIG